MKFWSRAVDLAPLIDVHEQPAPAMRAEDHAGDPVALAKAVRRALLAHGRLFGLPESATCRNPRPPQDLRKAYGRASRTIHQLRGEAALLREELDARDEVISEDAEVIAELQAALDTTRPAPDPAVLGEQLKAAWFRPRAQAVDIDQRWTQVAETAIDAVRGLWPQVVPGPPRAVSGPPRSRSEAAADDTPLAEWEIALLDAEADRRLGPDIVIGPDGCREHRLAWLMRLVNGHRPVESTGFEGMRVVRECSCGWKADASGAGGQHSWHLAEVLDTQTDVTTPTNVAGGGGAADPPAAAPRGGEPPAPGDTDDVVDAVIHNSGCDGSSPCDCEVRYLAYALYVESWREPRGGEGWMRVARRAVKIVRDLRIGEPAADTAAPGDTLAEQAETHREQLAQVIASADLDLTGGRWATTHDGLRAYYRGRADAVVLAGWRPPLGVDQRPVVAQVLTDHELLADGACRCGQTGLEIWHADHVAEQLVGTGVLA